MATRDGNVEGLVGGIPSGEEGVAELVSMWVAPGARGAGVAAKLIAAVVAWAGESGLATLNLWVVEGNESAERAYAKAGFVRSGRRQLVRVGEPSMEFQMSIRVGRGP